jgi:hypothetical protein
MKPHQVFQFVLSLSLTTVSLAGCNQSKTFQLDKQLLTNFQNHKAEMLTLMQKCRTERESRALKRHIVESFWVCKAYQAQLKPLNVQEMALEDPGTRILFVADQYEDDSGDTFVEEKGYVYSATPLKQDVIKNGTLDQFTGQLLFEKRSRQEAWRYKQIAPNWYLYYRQYFYPYLG